MNKVLIELGYLVRIIITPGCWIRNNLTNRRYSKIMEAQLEKHQPARISPHRATLNGVEVWVSNYPYDYGSDETGRMKGLPSRRVAFMLRDAMGRGRG